MRHILRLMTAITLFLAMLTAEAGVATYDGKVYLSEHQQSETTPLQTVCVAAFRLYGLLHGLEYETITASEPEAEGSTYHNMSVVGITSTTGVIKRDCKTLLVPDASGKMVGMVAIHLDGIMYDVYIFGFMADTSIAVVREE